MRKTLVTTIAALSTAMLFTVTAANAAVYKFTFQSNDAELTATGEITVNAAEQVTAVSGVDLRPDRSDHQRGLRQSEFPEPVL